MMKLKAPFPYFGGKSNVADIVWDALGQPAHYMEPFFGSGAVLLNRPNYDPQKHTETIVDADGFVANAWRAMQQDPDGVAKILRLAGQPRRPSGAKKGYAEREVIAAQEVG